MKITQQRNDDKNTTLSTMSIDTGFAYRPLNRIKQYSGIPLFAKRVSLFGRAR